MESAQRRYSKPRITRDHLHEKYNTDLGLHRGISHFLSLKATWSKKQLQIGKVMTTESTSRTRPGWGAVVVAGGGGCWTRITYVQSLCRQASQASPEGQLWTLRHEHQFSQLHCHALGLPYTLGSGEAEHLYTNSDRIRTWARLFLSFFLSLLPQAASVNDNSKAHSTCLQHFTVHKPSSLPFLIYLLAEKCISTQVTSFLQEENQFSQV